MYSTGLKPIARPRVAVTVPWRNIAVFTLFFSVTVILQILGGAYRSEFAGYPDESAHYVTSLMVRDFIAGLDYTEPMKFANEYYAHYPKVAFGHWPPLLYLASGLWMLIFSSSRASVLLELAFLTTLLASLTCAVVKRLFGWPAGVLAGLLLVCLPIVQVYSDEVMAESLLAFVSFAAVIYFARFLKSNRWQDSAMFGVFASLAIMTKGSGWDLAIVPPLTLILTRNFRILTRGTLWLAALIVALICSPWQLMTFEMAQRGWQGGDQPTVAYTARALGEFAPILLNLLGWSLAPLILIGIAVTVVVPFFKNRVDPEWAAFFSLVVAAWIFHSVVPAGVEDRKLVIAIPALILFLVAGGYWLAQKLKVNPAIVAVVAIAAFGIQKFSINREIHYGYSEAAHFIESRPDLRTSTILVSSERDGEGMLISEVAMLEKRPMPTIFRATKVLSKTDWNGTTFECYYSTPEALLGYLKKAGIGLLVSDTLPAVQSMQHQRVVDAALQKYPRELTLVATFRGDLPGGVNVYRVN